MKRSLNSTNVLGVAMIMAVTTVANPSAFGQRALGVRDSQEAAQRAQHQEKLQQVLIDRAGYAAAVVRRWEDSARAMDRWDINYAANLQEALMKLQPEDLLTAGEAPSYEVMMRVLATGHPEPRMSSPNILGDSLDDLVFTPVAPCRIVDTRFAAAGALIGNVARTFDVDGSSFTAQGGVGTTCGIPIGVARAVAMTITVTQTNGYGFFTAWGLGAQPLSSVLNFVPGDTLANTTIVPVVPGAGNDFTLYSLVTAHAIVDVLGYFATPVATALDCTTVSSAVTAVPVNSWTPIDANCPAGRTATGGGYDTTEGTLGYPGVWLTSVPITNGWRTWVDNQTNGSRSIQTFARCCRVPGR